MNQSKSPRPVKVYKYAKLQLNFVLHKRFKKMSDLPRIKGCGEAISFLYNHYQSLSNAQEFFSILLLNRQNRILGITTVGQGNKHATIVDIPYILSLVLLSGASSIIIAHNHPSAHPEPSSMDIELTKKIKVLTLMLDIEFVDHIILTSDPDIWYSMAQDNKI